MTALNRLLAGAFDVLLWPIQGLPPLAGLAICSLATAMAMLLVVKATSDQTRVALVKRAIQADLFEVRLFSDDLRAVFRAQGGMLRHTLAYLRLSLVPTLWLIVPFGLIFGHLESHYGYAGLTPGEPALVTATLRADTPDERALGADATPSLEAPAAIRVDTPAVWFPASREVVWQITPQSSGEFELRVHAGHEAVAKSVQVSDAALRRSPTRTDAGVLNQLFYPSEAPLPGAVPLEAVSVAYPRREIRIFGWGSSWIVPYVALSLAFAGVLRRPFKVVM